MESSNIIQYTWNQIGELIRQSLSGYAGSLYSKSKKIVLVPSDQLVDIISNEIAEIVNLFLEREFDASSPVFSINEPIEDEIERFLNWLARSNKYILKTRVDQFVTQLLIEHALMRLIEKFFTIGVQGEGDPSLEQEMEMFKGELDMFWYLPALDIPKDLFKSLQRNRTLLYEYKIQTEEEYFFDENFSEVIQDWFYRFRIFQVECRILPNQIFINCQTAFARIPSKPAYSMEERDYLIACYNNEEMRVLDPLLHGPNTLKMPIVSEWVTPTGDRLPSEYYMNGVFGEENIRVKTALMGEKILFQETLFDPTVLAIIRLDDLTEEIFGGMKRIAVISNHVRNWLQVYNYCKKLEITAFFLPERTSHWFNPLNRNFGLVRDNVLLQLFQWLCKFPCQSPNYSLLLVMKAYRIMSVNVYQNPAVTDLVKRFLTGFDTTEISSEFANKVFNSYGTATPFYHFKTFYKQVKMRKLDPMYFYSPNIRHYLVSGFDVKNPFTKYTWEFGKVFEESDDMDLIKSLENQKKSCIKKLEQTQSKISTLNLSLILGSSLNIEERKTKNGLSIENDLLITKNHETWLLERLKILEEIGNINTDIAVE